ncbi:MAG TPA: hypothetical protein VGQ57_17945 [Polyangiaceae bacterium]|jgi:hypothetical protein|nr:hypothetical protein [Polyangiaceae bacterium]
MSTRRQRRRQNREAWRKKRRKSAGSKRRSPARRKGRRTGGWSSDFALGRAYGVRAPQGMKRKRARRYVAKEGLRKARKAAGRRLTYNDLMTALRGTKLKAWVCAGPTRTGCGGGRRRYGGSRQIGVLRP